MKRFLKIWGLLIVLDLISDALFFLAAAMIWQKEQLFYWLLVFTSRVCGG